ncbi:MAG: amidohydrolase family protein [Planctomycetales bacterium]
MTNYIIQPNHGYLRSFFWNSIKMNARQSLFMVLAVNLLAIPAWCATPIPGATQKHPIALTGGTIHPMTRPAFVGTLLFDKGRIVAVGADVKTPPGTEIIKVPGKHVYPAMIDSHTQMGLVEIGAVRATRDQAEVGSMNPNVKAQVAVNPDSEMIPVARSNGVALTLTVPTGGTITGTSALLQLDGWSWEDLTLKAPVAMHLDWPRMAPIQAWWMKKSPQEQKKERDETLRKLKDFFDQARHYGQARRAQGDGTKRQEFDARLEAMAPVLAGKIPLIVSADEIRQIQAAVAFASREKVRLILHGGYDAMECVELLRSHDVPVIVGGSHRLPRKRDDAFDEPFTLPKRLHEAGIRFCIAGNGGASNVRNLPYHAATAAAHGLPVEEALKAVTIYPAKILDAADRVGSLEVGKDATLIVVDGNPLDVRGQVEQEFIQGRRVDLNDKHKTLWNKYREKYRRLRERE